VVAFGAVPGAGPSDDLVGVHRGDGIRVVAEFGENLVGVLAEQRRARDLGREPGKLDRAPDRQVRAAILLLDLDERSGPVRGRGRSPSC
jgi:hypothetical protein